MSAAPDPSNIPPQGLSHILGADAWWEGDKSSCVDAEKVFMFLLLCTYFLSLPLLLPSHSGLKMGRGNRRHWQCKEWKSATAVKVRSLWHTLSWFQDNQLSIFLTMLPWDCLCSPAVQSPVTSAKTASEKRIAAEIKCHVDVLKSGNKAHPCSQQTSDMVKIVASWPLVPFFLLG